jgi:hypothetical protein
MIFSTWAGYTVMKDAQFFPKYLGGSGDYALLFKDYPYPEQVWGLREYYILITSYHFG